MTYEIRIRGRLSEGVVEALSEASESPVQVDTVLAGIVRDQAELHGLLARLQQHGLEIVALHRAA